MTARPDDVARPPLRVALIITRRGPAWQLDVLTALSAGGDVAVAKIAIVAAPARRPPSRIGDLLLRLYGTVDRRVFGRADDPTRTVDLASGAARLFPNASIAGADTRRAQGVPAADPDLVIRLAPAGAAATPRTANGAASGVWHLDHGFQAGQAARDDSWDLAPGGRELLLGGSVIVTRLISTTGTGATVVGTVVSAVDRLSLQRGAGAHLRKVPGLVARAAAAIREGRLPSSPVDEGTPVTVSAERHLSAARIVVGLLRIVVGFVTRLILRTVAPERWVVAVSRGAWTTPIEAGRRSRILEPPDGIEWADPFPVSVAGTDLLFVEEYVRAEHKGRLAVVELDGDRGWRSVTTILDQATHLSYPFVFEWERAWYLMPEQATTGSLELFVATEFPTGWRHHSTVLDRPAADATIAEIDGRWWMFAAIAASPGAAADELHLFHAATPLGPWTAHVANPVVSDVRTARPAGRPFRRDGVWHRVAQDGAVSYGHAMAILRIDRLDLSGYHETVVDTILPRWAPGIIATHTFNADGDLVALDALRRELRIPRRRSS